MFESGVYRSGTMAAFAGIIAGKLQQLRRAASHCASSVAASPAVAAAFDGQLSAVYSPPVNLLNSRTNSRELRVTAGHVCLGTSRRAIEEPL